MAKRRAITDEQKAERRQKFVDAAWRLFRREDYERITMSSIAKAADLAKGTLYLYFNTKEALFLEVQSQQLQAWFDELETRLTAPVVQGDIDAVAKSICASLQERPLMTRLLTILHPVLEHNVERETALAFKRMLLTRVSHTGALLEHALSHLSPGDGVRCALWFYMIVLGLEQLSHPAPIVQDIITSEPHIDVFDLDFTPACADSMAALLRGVS